MSTRILTDKIGWKTAKPAPRMLLVAGLLAMLSLMGCGKGSKDILTPEERRWLTENQGRLVVGIETQAAPLVFQDSDGQIRGLAHDHLLLLESKLGVRFQRRDFSTLDEIFAKVRSGEVQVVNGVTQTPWRSEFISFAKPFVTVPNVIVVRKERLEPMRPESLRGLSVSLVRSFAVTEYLTRRNLGLVPELVPDDLTGLLNVSFGRTDAAVTDLATASYLIQQKGITNLRVAGEAGFDIQLSMGASRQEPRLFVILQKGLGAITEDERQEIRKRWIHVSGPSFLTDWRFWVAVVGGLCGILSIIATVLAWNRALRAQVALRTQALAEEKESLRESEARNRALLSAIPDLIFLNHRDGTFLDFHSLDPGQLFVPPERFLHHRVSEVLPKSLGEQFQRAYSDALELDSLQEFNYSLDIEGMERRFEARVVPCTRDTVITIVRDVTERKRAEHQQRELQMHLLQAQKMESLGSLAGGVAHDMNNVLGAILGLASAHLEIQPAGSPVYRAFDTISQAATRGGKMVKSLLNFARQSPAEELDLDLNAILQDEVRLLERTTLSRIRLEMDLAPDLRPMRGDASALTHAFMNLCVNAVDAMTDCGTLTLRTRNVDADWIEVRVEDTGVGMSAEVLAKAMDPFFSTKPQGKGTGLGLSMVYSTVKAHQGQLEIESEPGQGTRVRLRFPVSQAGAQVVEPSAQQASTAPTGALNVLLVDDDELIQSSMLAILEVLGHRATVASSGEEALAQLEGGLESDVVILDMNMPGLGGAGTLPRLRALRPNLPILLATGRADQVALDLTATQPFVTLLSKPFTMVDLQKVLEPFGRA